MARKNDCPICGEAAQPTYRPFCSKRCADRDLGRWLSGHYRIAALEPPDEFELEAELRARDAEGGEGDGNA
ncbi:MAG: DNA gyrase inhibitor YacG [Alphaproteobacteria bacterium]|jgi:hypothetical protein|nr:DNA gyrase inhibitor YacG [Alphaproteobacteria bacterium]